MVRKPQHPKSQNIGLWIFLSVLLVVVALFAYAVYSNQQAVQQQQQDIQKTETQQQQQDSKSFTDGLNRTACLNKAESDYWSFVKINSTSTEQTADGPVYYANQDVWDTASNNRENAKNECYRAYPAS